MTTPSDVTVTFELPQDEQVRGSRIVTHRLPIIIGMYVLCALGFVGALVLALVNAVDGDAEALRSAAVVALTCIVGAVLLYISPWLTVRQWRKNLPIHQGPHVWKLSADGLSIQSPHSANAVGWALIREVFDTEDFLLFYVTKQYAYMLPKRVLSTEAAANVQKLVERYCMPTCPIPRGWVRSTAA